MVEIPKNDIESNGVDNFLDNLKNTVINWNLNNLDQKVISQEKKEDLEKGSVKAMNQIGDLFKIQIPFLWDLWTLFGKKRPIDLFWTKEERAKSTVINWILNFFHFKSLEELHQTYIEHELKWIDKDFANECFQEYKKSQQIVIPDDQKTRKICGLDAILTKTTEEEKTKIQNKVPEDFTGLKNTLITKLPENINKLNISTVNMIDPSLIISQDNKKIIDIAKIQAQPEQFIDKYLKITIPAFIQSGDEFINAEEINGDTFAFALFGNLTGEKFFVEGVHLGIIGLPPIAKTESTDTDTNETSNTEQITLENKALNTLTFDEAKLLTEKVFGKGPATDLLYAMSNNEPAMIQRVIALGQHEWWLIFGRKNEDPNKKSEQINIGTFQISGKKKDIVKKRNKNLEEGIALLKQNNISYTENDFKKIQTYKDITGNTKNQKAQTDLLVWLGFVSTERGGNTTFTKLADPKLSTNDIATLMSKTIQWGIPAIGKDVVAQINTKSTNDYPQLV